MVQPRNKYARRGESMLQIREPVEGEIRLSMKSSLFAPIDRCLDALKEAGHARVVAVGNAVSRAVQLSFIVRRRTGCHFIMRFDKLDIVDIYDPLEKGLDVVELKRTLPVVIAEFSSEPLDESDPGYHPPLEVKGLYHSHHRIHPHAFITT
jgi:hypothetical protein